MGLFDIFKKTEEKKVPAEPVEDVGKESTENTLQTKEPAGYSGDLEKTEILAGLVAVPVHERDEQWVARFLFNLPLASLKSGTPQLIAGPDGFPYFQLYVPQPGESYQSFIIERMIEDFLLVRGYGVVINPGDGEPDWVLTYGDTLNYYLAGSFFTTESHFSSGVTSDEIAKEGEEILIGQPSEEILPVATRKLLKDFFELNGIENPKVMLIMRKNGDEIQSQDLAFNITPENFESADHYKNMMQTVTWYLPRHYSIVGLNDDNTENGFMPL